MKEKKEKVEKSASAKATADKKEVKSKAKKKPASAKATAGKEEK